MLHLQRVTKTSTRAGIGRLDAIRDEVTTLAAEHKAEGDSMRRLPVPLAEAFVRHDVYRLLLPHDLAGSAVDPLD
ncbi:hypothetical protein [Neorhizobium sp. T7_12]|uniref:hypothetical protein n=1 Tax=Neorhizobium sp. T7_12 TaxID=2093832 RepID=UPI000CFA4EB7|nr:hypothetical protein [Neorhizobium sp. T7_12]